MHFWVLQSQRHTSKQRSVQMLSPLERVSAGARVYHVIETIVPRTNRWLSYRVQETISWLIAKWEA